MNFVCNLFAANNKVILFELLFSLNVRNLFSIFMVSPPQVCTFNDIDLIAEKLDAGRDESTKENLFLQLILILQQVNVARDENNGMG